MLETKDCFVKENCKKYIEGNCNNEFCIRLFKLETLYRNSLLTEAQWLKIPLYPEATGIDKFEFNKLKQIEQSIVDFVNNGKNLYLHSSNCGNGKTAWSIRLMQTYLNKIWPQSSMTCRALFINVPRFLLALKDNISVKSDYIEYIKENVLTADIVVWDELGIKNATTFEMENLLNLINTRIDYNKSNIYTSNLKPNELREKLGDRLYSRVVNLSEDIELHGGDKRGIR